MELLWTDQEDIQSLKSLLLFESAELRRMRIMRRRWAKEMMKSAAFYSRR